MHGDRIGQWRLGVCYGNGEGVAQDTAQAYLWLSLAAAGGYEEALTARDEIATMLSPEIQKQTQEAARKLQEEIQASKDQPDR
jgi:TPR repeat protein